MRTVPLCWWLARAQNQRPATSPEDHNPIRLTLNPAPHTPKRWLIRKWEAIGAFLADDLWERELGSLTTFRAWLYKLTRVAYLTARGFHNDRCMLRASALTFMTGLSIVPLLAFVFAVAKGLGAYDSLLGDVILPMLDQHLGSGDVAGGIESGSEVRGAIEQVLAMVQNTRVSSLGTFGAAILVYTIVKMLGSIEQTFNEIWGVHKSRSLLRKLSDYLSIIVVVPILLTSATALTTYLQGQSLLANASETLGLNSLLSVYGRVAPFVAVWIGFTFVYMFMPNTRVRLRSAVLGGLVGGALWQLAQILHLRFQVGVANYNAIYSTFAALPIFMFWMYLSWTTVLLGAEVACAHQQEPSFRQVMRARNHDNVYLQSVAVRLMGRVAVEFLAGREPLNTAQLADGLQVPERSIDEILGALQSAGIVCVGEESVRKAPDVLPARDLQFIRIQEILDALQGEGTADLPPGLPVDRETEHWLETYRKERSLIGSNKTLREMAQAGLLESAVAPGEAEGDAAGG